MTSTAEDQIVFLDTGFLRGLIGAQTARTFLNNFTANSTPRPIQNLLLATPATLQVTAFAFLEYLGVPKGLLNPPSPANLDQMLASLDLDALFDHFLKYFSTHPLLSANSLRDLERETRKHLDPHGQRLWARVTSKGFASDVSSIHAPLAFDRVHNIVASKPYASKLHDRLFYNGFLTPAASWVNNMSKFRIAWRLWVRLQDGLTTEMREKTRAIHQAVKLKSSEDYGDSDSVHLSVLGCQDQNLVRRKVTIYSVDSPETAYWRTWCYKGMIKYGLSHRPEEAAQLGHPTNFESLYNGFVHCFNVDGTYIDTVDVAAIQLPTYTL